MGALMKRNGTVRALLAGMAATAVSAGAVVLGGGTAQAAPVPVNIPVPMPAHVSAPYFETWTGESPAAEAAASGNKYLTLAFLHTETAGSCTAYWKIGRASWRERAR